MAPIPHFPDLNDIPHWPRSITHLPAQLHPTNLLSNLHNALALHPHSSIGSTTPDSPSKTSTSALMKRQTTIVAIPTTYAGLNGSPQPGVVAGIVLGAVGGTLIVLWLIYTIFSIGGARPNVDEVEVIRRRASRSPPRRNRRSETRSETIEVSRHRTPPPRRREREIIVEETTTRRQSAPPPPDDLEDDVVEVIEEHSPPRQERRSRRVSSGYRNVDPDEYGGGSRRMRPVR